jgi:hypothetical protein
MEDTMIRVKDLKAELDFISEEESCMNEVTEVEASQVQGPVATGMLIPVLT